MTTNKYFNHFSYAREQDLMEDLWVESTKIFGIDCKYLPHSIVNQDNLYGEDPLMQFNTAANVEVFIVNVDGFSGEGDFLSKFGLEIRDQMSILLPQKRFDQIKTEKLMTEVGYNYQLETANTQAPGNSDGIELEAGNGDNYTITSSRPLEGDLIYFPLNGKMFEIKFVEHEQPFYPNGRQVAYELQVELFQYSSERLDTGDATIDAIETRYSLNVANNRILLETSDALLEELDGDFILTEVGLADVDSLANNQYFETEAAAIIEFSGINPYGDATY
jgi:hypothetical protein